ncbi:MAG: class I SAM-dependent methyltransferase [Candidatus Aminicenantales bacterium]
MADEKNLSSLPKAPKADSISPQAREHYLNFFAQRWAAVTPPMRPSREELVRYEKAILGAKPRDGATALILGSTPELRSLALKHRLESTGCDIDDGVWKALTSLRTVEGEEGFIQGNWLNLPESRQYDFILGDCSFNMLTWDEMQKLATKIRALLKEDGISIQRIQAAPESLTLDMIGQAVAAYRRGGFEMPLFFYLIFLGEALRNLFRPEMNNREFFESVVFNYLTPEEASQIRPALVDRKFGYAKWKDMLALLERHFTIVHEEKSTEPGIWDTASVFVLKKKP